MFKHVRLYLVVFMLLSLSALYGVAPLFLPQPLTATAPPDLFSATRARQHVAAISKEVHPSGSLAMENVAAYLSESLKQIGLVPEIQEAEAHNGFVTVNLHNVVARIPGTTRNGSVLIVTHPDSTAFSPGAGDNATGVAVLLEVARAIKSGPLLQNDIILLFDDGEEFGQIGYQGGFAFAREHPWMADVRLVVGLDVAARGPVVLQQTAPQNGALIRGYAAAVRSPVAFGAFADADWNIAHNNSEILPFHERGLPGIELGDSTDSAEEHTPGDTIDKVNLASMQQMGNQVLSMARQYGNMDLNQALSADESYFTLLGLGMVHYPARINAALTILAALSMVWVIVLGIRQNLWTGKGLGIGSLYVFAILFAAGMVGMLAPKMIKALFPPPPGSSLWSVNLTSIITTLVLAIGIYVLGRILITRRMGNINLAIAGLVFWLLLGLVCTGLLQIGSYVFIWPLLLALAGWGWILYRNLPVSTPLYRTILIVPAIVATILMVPNLAIVYLGSGLIYMPFIAVLVVMILDLWSPVVE